MGIATAIQGLLLPLGLLAVWPAWGADLLARADYKLTGKLHIEMPDEAQAEQREGSVIVECQVLDSDGTLNCAAADERPTGLDFASVAVQALAALKAAPTDPDHPIVGRSFQRPVYFKLSNNDYFLEKVPNYHAAVNDVAMRKVHKSLAQMHVAYSQSTMSCTIKDEAGHIACVALHDGYPVAGMLDAVIDSLDDGALAAPFVKGRPMTGQTFTVSVM